MIFFNSVPVSDQWTEWQESGIVPDIYPWPDPRGPQPIVPGAIALTVPDDLEKRHTFFLHWLILQSAWCQLFRQPQTSHVEYQGISDYLVELETEMGYEVPPKLGGFPTAEPLRECLWNHNPSRYPTELLQQFALAGYEINPTSPLDDPRHVCYDYYIAWRIMKSQQRKETRLTINPRTGQVRY